MASENPAVEELWRKSCKELNMLKEILRKTGQNVSGNKAILVARCYANLKRDDRLASQADDPHKDTVIEDPLKSINDKKEVGFDDLNVTAKGRQWETDLRKLPKSNFHQLFEYVVVRTKKYGEKKMKGVCYKKMRAYNYFREGNIKNYEIANGFGKTWVKARVIASMKQEMRKVISIFNDCGDVLFAACSCTAGKGLKGTGKCNHLGGLLFAINDFSQKGLHASTERVSSTSKLNGWVVPRNLNVPAKPIEDIKIEKIQFGKPEKTNKNTVNNYDPRAPQDKCLDPFALNKLYDSLEEFAPNSAFFLYHDVSEASTENDSNFKDTLQSENVHM